MMLFHEVEKPQGKHALLQQGETILCRAPSFRKIVFDH